MNLEHELTELQGPGGMTASKEILIKSTVEAFGVLLLAAMYCKRAGVIRPDMARHGVIELQPVLGKQFLAFLNTVRQNLVALGLERKKADDILDLGRYLETKAKGAETQPSGQGDAGIGAQARPGSEIPGDEAGDLPDERAEADAESKQP
jgi:hypothetical protein